MSKPVQALAESLQVTSRVLSKRNDGEQAQIQECAIQMLGLAILEQVDIVLVVPPTPPAAMPALSFKEKAMSPVVVWQSEPSGHVVIAQAVEDEDDWAGLPLMFQNYVKERDFPCQFIVFIESMQMEGDAERRHYVEPVFWILGRSVSGGANSRLVMGTDHLRSQSSASADEEALAHVEPYLHIAYVGLASVSG